MNATVNMHFLVKNLCRKEGTRRVGASEFLSRGGRRVTENQMGSTTSRRGQMYCNHTRAIVEVGDLRALCVLCVFSLSQFSQVTFSVFTRDSHRNLSYPLSLGFLPSSSSTYWWTSLARCYSTENSTCPKPTLFCLLYAFLRASLMPLQFP